MVQVRCILYGLGQGGYIELWMNLAKHTFHTLSAWSFPNFFRLNLAVVRLASGFHGLVRASPSLFHKMGSFAGDRSAIRVRLLGIGSVFWIRLRFKETVRLYLFAPLQVDVTTPSSSSSSSTSLNLPLSCAKLNWSITLHLTVYALRQVKLSFARFNQIVIILRHNLVN